MGWFPGTNTPPITFLSLDFPSLMIHSIYAHTHTHPIPGKSVLPEKSRETEENTEDGSQRKENARNSTAITKGVRGDESGQLRSAFHFRGMPWETNDKKSINPERTHHHHLLTAKKGRSQHTFSMPSVVVDDDVEHRPARLYDWWRGKLITKIFLLLYLVVARK